MSKANQTGGSPRLAQGIIVLALICLGSGLGVGTLYSQMKQDIEHKRENVFQESLAEVLGPADQYQTVGEYAPDALREEIVYRNETDSGVFYAAMGSTNGYQSKIRVLASVKVKEPDRPVGDDPVIHRISVVFSQETPGLGARVEEVQKDVSLWARLMGRTTQGSGRPWFQEQFDNKKLSDLKVEKDQGGDSGVEGTTQATPLRPITGATITSRATTGAVRKAVENIIKRTTEVYGE